MVENTDHTPAPKQLQLFAFVASKKPSFVAGTKASGGSRVDLIKVLQYRVRASSDLPLSIRIELREVLEKLKSKDDDDTRAIAACRFLRDAAPRIWDESKPVLDALIGETVRQTLEEED